MTGMDTGAGAWLASTGGIRLGADVIHRLGVTVLLAVVLFALLWTVLTEHGERRARRRVRQLLGYTELSRPRLRTRLTSMARRRGSRPGELPGWVPVLGAACAGFVIVGGLLGVGLGGLGGYGVGRWLRRRERSSDGPRRDGTGGSEGAVSATELAEAERQLPLAADLVAACVTAGAGPAVAAEAVGESLGGPVGDRLARAAVELRLGGESAQVWGRLGSIPGARPLARCLARACDAGAPAAEELSLIAADCRAAWSRAAASKAHRAGVLISAPVGLCLLPAFLAVGVVPVVIGLAGGVLNID
ncbi:type II secretion system F family protein [Streptomyces sp. Da 82-17]|uniref:type II secretion system F family protein n=1 Tax=Streptomyces sp. Da 82-17 TaxID=3377116 RepID=UPI0038D4A34E